MAEETEHVPDVPSAGVADAVTDMLNEAARACAEEVASGGARPAVDADAERRAVVACRQRLGIADGAGEHAVDDDELARNIGRIMIRTDLPKVKPYTMLVRGGNNADLRNEVGYCSLPLPAELAEEIKRHREAAEALCLYHPWLPCAVFASPFYVIATGAAVPGIVNAWTYAVFLICMRLWAGVRNAEMVGPEGDDSFDPTESQIARERLLERESNEALAEFNREADTWGRTITPELRTRISEANCKYTTAVFRAYERYLMSSFNFPEVEIVANMTRPDAATQANATLNRALANPACTPAERDAAKHKTEGLLEDLCMATKHRRTLPLRNSKNQTVEWSTPLPLSMRAESADSKSARKPPQKVTDTDECNSLYEVEWRFHHEFYLEWLDRGLGDSNVIENAVDQPAGTTQPDRMLVRTAPLRTRGAYAGHNDDSDDDDDDASLARPGATLVPLD